MGRDHDLVRVERPHGVLDGDERVAVTHLAVRVDSNRCETGQRVVQPLLRGLARGILVRGERPQT